MLIVPIYIATAHYRHWRVGQIVVLLIREKLVVQRLRKKYGPVIRARKRVSLNIVIRESTVGRMRRISNSMVIGSGIGVIIISRLRLIRKIICSIWKNLIQRRIKTA